MWADFLRFVLHRETRRLVWLSVILIGPLVLIAGSLQSQTAPQKNPSSLVRVIIETQLGEIEVALDTVRAPVTTANFLRYVDGKYYDGGLFHRTVTLANQPNNPVRIEVIQGGMDSDGAHSPFPAIPLERTSQTGLRHLDGTISMARDTPDTATSDFFFCIGKQPSLDFGGNRNPDGQGFAAFGQVVRGMDVVRKIQNSPANGQNLTPRIKITKAYRKL